MSNSEQHHGHEAAAPTGAPELRFTDAEWSQFQADDRHAGGAVLVLMTGIFTMGLILYIGVYFWVGMG